MKRIVLLFSICLICLSLRAQTEATPLKYSIGYLGEFVYHPGFTIGVDYTLRQIDDTRIIRIGGNSKIWSKSIVLRGEILGFNHPDNSFLLSILPQVFFRKTAGRGLYTEVGVGAGYLRAQYHAPVVEIIDGIVEEYAGGRSALVYTIGVAVGQENRVGAQKNIGWFLRAGILYEIPYNESLATRVLISAGINYSFVKAETPN